MGFHKILAPKDSVFTLEVALAVTKKKIFQNILRLIIRISFHELGLLARFLAKHFYLLFYLSFMSLALTQFYCTFFQLPPIDMACTRVVLDL
jgi:hypothetical protein